MKIIVFGSARVDCEDCRAAERMVEELIAPWGAEVEYRKCVVNTQEAKQYRIMITPSIVVNGKVVTHGAVPDRDQLRQFLEAERTAK